MACEEEQALYDAAHQAELAKQAELDTVTAQLLVAVADQGQKATALVQAQLDKQAIDAVVAFLLGQVNTKTTERDQLLAVEQQALTALQNCQLGQANQNP